jgi:hypothetical protein
MDFKQATPRVDFENRRISIELLLAVVFRKELCGENPVVDDVTMGEALALTFFMKPGFEPDLAWLKHSTYALMPDELKHQHPWLRDEFVSGVTVDNYPEWVANLKTEYGEYLSVGEATTFR